MKKIQNYLCVDVRTEMNDRDMVPGEKRLVEAMLDVEDSEGNPYPDTHFTLLEIIKKVRQLRPELHWRLLDRTKHGKADINSRHVKVEFYIHHDEYQNAAELADMLAQEIEVMGENLCNMNLKEEVAKCLC